MMIHTASLTALTLGLLLAVQSASAQVHRCTDPKSGRTTYSNVGCGDGEQAHQIERPRSGAEIQAERAEADAARQRFEAQQSRETAALQTAAAAPAPAFRANQSECERALRNADTAASSITSRGRRDSAADREANIKCYGSDAAAHIEQARAGAPKINVQPSRLPPGMARCDRQYCYDSAGIAYFKNGH